MELKDVKKVRASWIRKGKGFVYDSIDGSLSTGSDGVRFKLKERDGTDEVLEIVIQSRDGAYFFKTDYYDEPEKELPVKMYTSSDELLFFYRGEKGFAYFHLAE